MNTKKKFILIFLILGTIPFISAELGVGVEGRIGIDFTKVWCELVGCTMQGDIDMGGNDIINIDTISANTYLGLPGGIDNNFHIFINSSAYNNVIYNLTAGDAFNIEVLVEPGRKFIFGDTFT